MLQMSVVGKGEAYNQLGREQASDCHGSKQAFVRGIHARVVTLCLVLLGGALVADALDRLYQLHVAHVLRFVWIDVEPCAYFDALAACFRARGPLGPLGHGAIGIDLLVVIVRAHCHWTSARFALHQLNVGAHLAGNAMLELASSCPVPFAARGTARLPLRPRGCLATDVVDALGPTVFLLHQFHVAPCILGSLLVDVVACSLADTIATGHGTRTEDCPFGHHAIVWQTSKQSSKVGKTLRASN